MKRINIKDYNPSMGILIDVRDPNYYEKEHYQNSINIPYNKLLLNYKTLLSFDKKYFITCTKGYKSKKAVSILEFYGYNVTQVYNDWLQSLLIYDNIYLDRVGDINGY